jgi:hypothetical protein
MLVLWELGLVVRFPPGATVLFTSGHVTHFNLPIPEGQSRWSFTQYMATGLVTLARNDCLRVEDLPPQKLKEFQTHSKMRGQAERGLYSTLESLEKDRQRLLARDGSFL